MKLIWKHLREYKKTLFVALFFTAVGQILSLFDPIIFRFIIDNYISKIGVINQKDFIYGVTWLLLFLVIVALLSRLAKTFQNYYSNFLAQKTSSNLYTTGLSHSLFISYRNFENHRSGEILQKIQSAKNQIQAFIPNLINGLFLFCIDIIFVIIYSFSINIKLGLAFLILSPILVISIFYIGKTIKKTQKEIEIKMIILSGDTTETLRNIELVKGLGLENQEITRLQNTNNQLFDLNLKKTKLSIVLNFFQGTLINIVRVSILFLMLWLVYYQNITIGQFFSLFFYLIFVFNPLNYLGDLSVHYQEVKASLEQMETILDIPMKTNYPETIKIEELSSIGFDRVCFNHSTNENMFGVNDINLLINKGETVAFVGPSGCGKTTLIKLLIGLYTPDKGSILFNNYNHFKIDYDHLRRKIGLVSQETQLFSGTIRENLLFIKPQATEIECLTALKNASIIDIVTKGKNGLDTIIGEGGMKLSGGERQRLAIARALLRQPDLLIFDEATSNLDTLAEQEITETIKTISQNNPSLITIIIAHRLSTTTHADRIYVLESGKIIATGSHQELINQDSLYTNLWQKQTIA